MITNITTKGRSFTRENYKWETANVHWNKASGDGFTWEDVVLIKEVWNGDTTKAVEALPEIKKRKLVDCRNTTGFNGVSQAGNKFRAQIQIDGKNKHLGIFTRATDAAMAYDEAVVELSGRSMDELKLNFPDGVVNVSEVHKSVL